MPGICSELALAEARERNRIAVSLRDGVSQSLAYAQMKLQGADAARDDHVLVKDMAEVSIFMETESVCV